MNENVRNIANVAVSAKCIEFEPKLHTREFDVTMLRANQLPAQKKLCPKLRLRSLLHSESLTLIFEEKNQTVKASHR